MRDLTREELEELLRLANKVIRSVKCEPYMEGNKYFLLIPSYKKAMEEYSSYLQQFQDGK